VTALIDSLEQSLYQWIFLYFSRIFPFEELAGALLYHLTERSIQGWLAVITAKYYQTENA